MKCESLKLTTLSKRFDLIQSVFRTRKASQIDFFDLLDSIDIQTNELIINSGIVISKVRHSGETDIIYFNLTTGVVNHEVHMNGERRNRFDKIIYSPYDQKTKGIDQLSTIYNICYSRPKRKVLVVDTIVQNSKTLRFLKINEIWDTMKDYRKLLITYTYRFKQKVLIEDPDLV